MIEKIQTFIAKNQLVILSAMGSLLLGVLLIIFLIPEDRAKAKAQEIYDLAQMVRKEYADKPDYWGLNTVSLTESNKDINISTKNITVGADEDANVVMPRTNYFVIAYHNARYSDCITLLSYFDGKNMTGVNEIGLKNERGITKFIWAGEYNLPIKKHDAKQLCASKNIIFWNFE